MDVRCERCKTDYEFEDARITEAGVTVKCTTCGHVFKVKKKALVVTVPVKPGELDQAHAPLTTPPSSSSMNAMAPPQAEKPREWKVRQASGNVFSFKELTTLQKWIVERKVSREDEISLTGENWKRLGNIAELASFFQVVDEAQKGQQLTALQSLQPLLTPPGGYVPQGNAQPLGFGPTTPSGSPLQMAPRVAVPLGAAPTAVSNPANAVPLTVHAQPPPMQQMVPQVSVTVHGNGAVPQPDPALVNQRSRTDQTSDDLRAAGVKKGGAGKWIAILLVLGGLGAGGYFGYFNWYLPQEQTKLREAEAHARQEAEAQAKAKADAEEKARLEKEAEAKKAAEAAKVVVASAPVDAGTVAPARATKKADESEEDVVPAKAVRGGKHDFNWYMSQGDRLREREKAEAALDAYGKAADLEPDRAEPIAGRGLALLDMGSKLQAEAAFEQALKVNPRYSVAQLGLAEAFRAEGKNAEAIKWYQKYLDENPSGSEANVAKEAIKKLQE